MKIKASFTQMNYNSEGGRTMEKSKEILYRGISRRFSEFPLTVSAMRKNEIIYLENSYKEAYGDDSYLEFKGKIELLPQSSIKFFSSVNTDCIWAFFLSMIHMLLVSKKYPSIIADIQYPHMFISLFENAVGQDEQYLPIYAFKCVTDIFAPDNDFDSCAKSYSTVSSMVYAYEYFQHINFNYRTENMNYNPFPTMVMDWTESFDIATQFAASSKDDGIIMAINYAKYKRMIYDDWFSILMMTDIAGCAPGLTPYFDCNFFVAAKNYNMQTQKGATLFWPWKYTVRDLLSNELGQRIGFTVVKE